MKKYWNVICTLLMIPALSGCGTNDNAAVETPVALPIESATVQEQPANAPPVVPNTVQGIFDDSLFDGKLRSCAYAGDGKMIVLADKLYLYDSRSGSVSAQAKAPLEDFNVQIFDNGYLLTDGSAVYLYDKELSLEKELIISDLLTDDFVFSETGIAVSCDGKKLAMAAMRCIYLYDLESGQLESLLPFDAAHSNNVEIGMVSSVVFIQNNTQIMFCGDGMPVPASVGEEGVSIYGTVDVNGKNLNITKKDSYNISEMQTRGGRLFCPQDFTKNNGTLLWIDSETGKESIITFSSGSEGGDGVYSSEQGGYIATAVLNDDLTIYIYEVSSGNLIHTEVITNPDSTYFYRIPQVYMFDDSKTAVILLGGRINEVDTMTVTCQFGE